MNVNLWFARDVNNEIISILDTTNENEYVCPICSSKVIPKALESKKMTPHFAHVDVTKCNSESMLHWWFKHKFIEKGDKFSIKTDSEIDFTCKDFNTEVTYQLDSGIYRPDLVIQTECGREIVFEMANTNKKKVQDYIDKWIELDKIVVEVDIKALQNVDEIKVFNALYYQGKCFNFNKRDGGYYNTIGKLKEEMKTSGKYDIELVKKLDWFWSEANSTVDVSVELMNVLNDLNSSEHSFLINTLYNTKCSSVISHYFNHLLDEIKQYLNDIDNLTNILSINKQESKGKRIVINISSKLNWNKSHKLVIDLHEKKQKIFNRISDYIISDVNSWNEKMNKIKLKNLKEQEVRESFKKKYMEFPELMSKDDNMRIILKELNKKIRNKGKIRLCRNSSMIENGYYNGKKQYRVEYYYYYLDFNSINGDYIDSVTLSDYIYNLNKDESVSFLFDEFERKFNEYKKGLNVDELYLLDNYDLKNRIIKNKYIEKIQNLVSNDNFTISYSLSNNSVVFHLSLVFDYGFEEIYSYELANEDFRNMNIVKLSELISSKFKNTIPSINITTLKNNLNDYHVIDNINLYFSNYKYEYSITNGEFKIFLADSNNKKVNVNIDIINGELTIDNIIFELEESDLDDYACLYYMAEQYIVEQGNIYCLDCNEKYNISSKEFVFFKNRGFDLPKRCKSCRQKRKQNK